MEKVNVVLNVKDVKEVIYSLENSYWFASTKERRKIDRILKQLRKGLKEQEKL
jgi:hypothetical protein